jgi:hypothetical protein
MTIIVTTKNVNDVVTATATATIDITHTLLLVDAVEVDTDAVMI